MSEHALWVQGGADAGIDFEQARATVVFDSVREGDVLD